MNRQEMIDAIVEAAREPIPAIKRIIESNETTERSKLLRKGARLTTRVPNSRVAGYAFANPQGHIYGRVEYDLETLINRHCKEEDAEMSKLRAQFERLNDGELISQAALWLSQNRPSRHATCPPRHSAPSAKIKKKMVAAACK